MAMFESYYNLYSELDDEMVAIMNCRTGAMDLIPDRYLRFVRDDEKRAHLVRGAGASPAELEVFAYFVKRGYVTPLDTAGEKRRCMSTARRLFEASKEFASLLIAMTYACNFRCGYCFYYGSGATRETRHRFKGGGDRVISRDQIDSVFSLIDSTAYRSYSIRLFGGEPLQPATRAATEYITSEFLRRKSDKQLKFQATTNGYYLNEFIELFSRLGENGFVPALQITFDGPERIHDRRRFDPRAEAGRGSFERISSNINTVLSTGIPIRFMLRTNLDPSNLAAVDELYEYYAEQGWLDHPDITVYFAPVYTTDLEKIRTSGGSPVEVTYPMIRELIDATDDPRKKELLFNTQLRGGKAVNLEDRRFFQLVPAVCGASTGLHVFDIEGSLHVCDDMIAHYEEAVGRFHPTRSYNEERLQRWRNRTVFNLPSCSDCKFALVCGGGYCPKFVESLTGDMYNSYCNDFPEAFADYISFVAHRVADNRHRVPLEGQAE